MMYFERLQLDVQRVSRMSLKDAFVTVHDMIENVDLDLNVMPEWEKYLAVFKWPENIDDDVKQAGIAAMEFHFKDLCRFVASLYWNTEYRRNTNPDKSLHEAICDRIERGQLWNDLLIVEIVETEPVPGAPEDGVYLDWWDSCVDEDGTINF